MKTNPEDDKRITALLKSGASALGVSAGAFGGFLLGGPVGAMAGAGVGALLGDGMKKVVGDAALRYTAQTEQERIGSVYILAHQQIAQKLNDGEPLRKESFFRPRTTKRNKKLRSEAEELLEGTFITAKNAYEERKLELLANFYTNIVFRNDIDSSHANHMLSLMESLTYRQLLCLLIIADEKTVTMVRNRDFRDEPHLNSEQIGLLFELYQLIGLGLVADKDGHFIMGVADINPANLKLEGTGMELRNMMIPFRLDFEEFGFFINTFPGQDLENFINSNRPAPGVV